MNLENKITYEEARSAKNLLIEYLSEKCDGYDGDDTFGRYRDNYLALLALKAEYFLQ